MWENRLWYDNIHFEVKINFDIKKLTLMWKNRRWENQHHLKNQLKKNQHHFGKINLNVKIDFDVKNWLCPITKETKQIK